MNWCYSTWGLFRKKERDIKKKVAKRAKERLEWADTRWDEEAAVGTRRNRRCDGEKAQGRSSEETQEWQMIFAAAIWMDMCQERFHLSGAEGRMLQWDVRWSEVHLWGWRGRLCLACGLKEESGRLQCGLEEIERCSVASVMYKVRLDIHRSPSWV